MLVWLAVGLPQGVKSVLHVRHNQRKLHHVAPLAYQIDQKASQSVRNYLICRQRCQVVCDEAALGFASLDHTRAGGHFHAVVG